MDLNISEILKTKGARLSFEFQERLDEIGFPALYGPVSVGARPNPRERASA